MTPPRYAPGTFCWFELVTSDQRAARAFYSELFAWTALEIPVPEGTYSAMRLEDAVVAGLFELDEPMRADGVQPHWVSYVSVTDVEASLARVEELGGSIVAGPADAKGQGRMGIATDASGVDFGLWQPEVFAGSERFGEPGTPCWTELMTRDPKGALEFYRGLFAWDARVAPGALGQDYTHLLLSGKPVAGMLEIQKEWGEVPPNWSLYFSVDDLDRALKSVLSLGGRLETEPMHVPGVARFCLVTDPQGVHFELMQAVT